MARVLALGGIIIVALLAGSAELAPQVPQPAPRVHPPTPRMPDPAATGRASALPVLVGAGDIANCDESGDEATAAIIARIAGTVYTTGDHAYPSGRARDFANCYAPSWGTFLDRTRPSPGNHDGADSAYFDYFGPRAGKDGEGWYAYDVGAWRVYALNSNCDDVGCTEDSPQLAWLRKDLADNPRRCVLAYWHHPRFSSARHGDSPEVSPFWNALYDARADVVLNGHDHVYERFDRQSPTGAPDPRGIRQFIVGTGGGNFYEFEEPRSESEVRNNNTIGVLKLSLDNAGYNWEFVPAERGGFSDSGRDECL